MTNKKILAIIPARGGSKEIPKKNIVKVKGKPLIFYSIKNAKESKYINRIIVSTDSKKIADISEKYGAEIPFLRPAELAKDESPTSDAVKHVLKQLKKKENYTPDLVVILQPTSPLRTAKTIDVAIQVFFDKIKNYDSLIPLYPIEGKTGVVKNEVFTPNYVLGSRRQDIEPVYKECGTIYIFKPELVERGDLFGEKIFPFVIKNYEESIDVDSFDDLKKVEYFMKLNK